MPRGVVKNPSGYRSSGRNAAEKAQQFALHAKAHGWSGKWTLDEESRILHLFARRGESETIEIWWHESGKACPDMLPVYTLAGERIKLRNVSAAAVRVAGEPDVQRLKKATKRARRKLTALTGEKPAEEVVPIKGQYDFSGMTDEDIFDALAGRTIAWVNSISGQMDAAVVSLSKKQFRVVRNGHDYVNFTQRASRDGRFGDGFRSVYLDNIVSVS